MKNKRAFYRQGGIALLEVMLSVSLLSVSLMGIMAMENSVDETMYQTEKKLSAINHLDDYFNQLRSRGADSDLSQATITDFDSGITTQTISFADGINLKAEVVGFMMDGNLKQIRVEASWVGKNGETDSISAMTMLSRYSEFDCSQPLDVMCEQ